jgi:hypothetical protein
MHVKEYMQRTYANLFSYNILQHRQKNWLIYLNASRTTTSMRRNYIIILQYEYEFCISWLCKPVNILAHILYNLVQQIYTPDWQLHPLIPEYNDTLKYQKQPTLVLCFTSLNYRRQHSLDDTWQKLLVSFTTKTHVKKQACLLAQLAFGTIEDNI